MKTCSKCGETDQAAFYRTGRWCRVCQREAVRDARYRKLGVSRDEYLAVLHGQLGACAICAAKEKPVGRNTRGLHLDHNHATGARRGVLCSRCNQVIGRVGESIELLEKTIAYLKQYS